MARLSLRGILEGVRLIFIDPAPGRQPAQIAVTQLDAAVPPDLLYQTAKEAFLTYEESLRNLQSRAISLTNTAMLILAGAVLAVWQSTSRASLLGFVGLLSLLASACFYLWALKPTKYLWGFCPWEIAEPPQEVKTKSQFLVWVALGYRPVIESIQEVCRAVALRIMAGTVLLIVGLGLFAFFLWLR